MKPEPLEIERLGRENRQFRLEREIPSRAAACSRGHKTRSLRRFRFVREYRAGDPVATMCRLPGVSATAGPCADHAGGQGVSSRIQSSPSPSLPASRSRAFASSTTWRPVMSICFNASANAARDWASG